MKKICIGSDHAGFELKNEIKTFLIENKYEVIDFGTFSSQSMDYPDIAHPIGREINTGKIEMAIIICGSGNGVSMVVNKYSNVRCALCWNEEISKFARLHNDANVLALPARFITKSEALNIVKIFLNTRFEGGRHQKRVDKIRI